MGTLPEQRPLLALRVQFVIVLDGVGQGELLTKIVSDLGLLPRVQRSVEGLSSLTDTYMGVACMSDVQGVTHMLCVKWACVPFMCIRCVCACMCIHVHACTYMW